MNYTAVNYRSFIEPVWRSITYKACVFNVCLMECPVFQNPIVFDCFIKMSEKISDFFLCNKKAKYEEKNVSESQPVASTSNDNDVDIELKVGLLKRVLFKMSQRLF